MYHVGRGTLRFFTLSCSVALYVTLYFDFQTKMVIIGVHPNLHLVHKFFTTWCNRCFLNFMVGVVILSAALWFEMH